MPLTFLPDDRPYVIAEVGGNHGGDLERAKDYVRAAAETGVDAVKFQLYNAETLITPEADPHPLAGDEYDSQYERFRDLELTQKEWREIIVLTESLDIDFTASVFDQEMADFLVAESDTPFIKVASGDLTAVPLLRYIASLDRPVVLSTGFATMSEIRRALDELDDVSLVLMHCMSSYPAGDDVANLQLIRTLDDTFVTPVGYSDHTKGTLAPTIAAGLGARIIEKHFTLNPDSKVGDHQLSATPESMAEIVRDTERLYAMFGDADRSDRIESERSLQTHMRRSLATAKPVGINEKFTQENLTAIRPETGLSPLRFDEVIGARASRALDELTILDEEDVVFE